MPKCSGYLIYLCASNEVELLYSDEQGWVDYLTQVLWWIVHVHLVLVTLRPTYIVHCPSLPINTISTVTLHPKRTWKGGLFIHPKTTPQKNRQTVHPPCICDILSKACIFHPVYFWHFVHVIEASPEHTSHPMWHFGQSTAVSNSPLFPGTSVQSQSQTFKQKRIYLPTSSCLYKCDDCVFGSPLGNVKVTKILKKCFVHTFEKSFGLCLINMKNDWFFAGPACFIEFYKLFHCHLLVNKINSTLLPLLPPEWTCPSAVEYSRKCTMLYSTPWCKVCPVVQCILLYRHHLSSGQKSLFCPKHEGHR
jgi:hypothetical protein